MDEDVRFEPVRSTLLDVEPAGRARRRPVPASELVELGPDPFPVDRRRTRLAVAAVAAILVAVTAVVVPLVAMGGKTTPPLPPAGADGDRPGVPVYVSSSAPAPATSGPSSGQPTPVVSRSPSPGPTSGPSPKPSAKPPRKPTSSGVPPTKAAPPPPVTSYHGIAGPGCPTLHSAGYAYSGWYANGRLGWVTDTAGSWTGNGCTGAWASMPMSGSNTPDPGISTQWWFVTGFATGTCSVDAYIPKGTRSWDSWGDPAYYQVLRSRTDSTVTATFTVGQKWGAAWASVGTFAITKGELVIKLLDRGTNNPDGQKLALGPIRVSCSA